MRSYKPEELFDNDGRLIDELAELAPGGNRRMGGNPHMNGGRVLRSRLPEFMIMQSNSRSGSCRGRVHANGSISSATSSD